MRIRIIALAALLSAMPAFANMGTDSSTDSDNADLQAGRKAVDAQDWKLAVEHLRKAVAAEPKNADAQNWLGFANRKLGNMDAAFSAYGEALKLDPRHKNAHEYIGEAYLLVGDVAKAEQHLGELQKLCSPIPCEEYKQLKRAVDQYKQAKK